MSHRLPLLLCSAAAFLAACDVDPASALDYDAVGHIELQALESSSWAKGVLKGGTVRFTAGGKDSDACGRLLKQADAVTFGVGHQRAELYLEGSLDKGDAQTCLDALADDLDKGDEIHSATLRGGVLAVAIGPAPLPAPTAARMRDLLDSDPSPKSDQPIWFVVDRAAKSGDFKYIEGWVDPRKGLDAHVQVDFADESAATKRHAEAALALTAAKMSGELGELAKRVKLSTAGETITADVRAPARVMETLMTEGKKKGDKDGKAKASFNFSIGSK